MNIFGTLYDKVGEGWHPIMDTFAYLVEWDIQHNKMPPVEIIGVDEKFNELRIHYRGGDKRTDAYWNFARAISAKIDEDRGRFNCE